LGNLGLVARDVGDRETADSLLRESLGIARDLGDRLGIAWPLTNLGLLASQRGDLPEARRQLNEALALWRELGDHQNIAYALSNLGGVATQQGDLASAENFLRESLTLLTRAGDKRGIAFVLERSAVLAVTGARPKLALVIAGHAAALRESIGAPQPPALRAAYQEQLEAARRGLSPTDAADAERKGARLALDELALAMASTGTDRA